MNSVGRTIFGDLPPPEILQMLDAMFDCKELSFDQVDAAGYSTDDIAHEVRRRSTTSARPRCRSTRGHAEMKPANLGGARAARDELGLD